MSRFYDALKQASQSLPGEKDDKDFQLSEPLGEFIEAGEGVSEIKETTSGQISSAVKIICESDAQDLRPRAGSRNGLGIPTESVLNERARLIPNAMEPMLVEQYRQLRTKLLRQQEKKPFRSLVVTSASPKEGKTLTVLNLGLIFSMLPSYRVLVIDGDLRRGHLSRNLGIARRPGLSDLLEGTKTLEQIVLKSPAIPFYFIGMGTSTMSPPELVHSSRWPNRIREISEHFDLTVVDSPPAGLVADAQLMATGPDAVLLVARSFRTSREDFENLRREFQAFRVLGTVLNGGPQTAAYRQYKSYYS